MHPTLHPRRRADDHARRWPDARARQMTGACKFRYGTLDPMNRPETPARLMPMPDVQSGRDERNLALECVGIKGLRYPLPFADGAGAVQATIATCNVYVAFPE